MFQATEKDLLSSQQASVERTQTVKSRKKFFESHEPQEKELVRKSATSLDKK